MYACIDLGSNSFHLLIGEWQDGRITITERCSEKVQLGEGVLGSHLICSSAFERGLECLKRFENLMAIHGVERYWALGTNTFRVAENAGQFIAAAADIGLEISIISGVQEAVLIYSGVISDLPPGDAKRFVIDIGGGSTELIVGVRERRLITHSLPVGCVSWRDQYFGAQDSSGRAQLEEQLAVAAEAARSLFHSVAPGVNHYDWSEAFASSGTAKMLATICQEHGEEAGEIRLGALRRLRDTMVGAIESGAELPGLKEKRRDLLLPGYAIMEGLMEAVSCDRITFSATALREGMLDFIVRSGEEAHTLDLSRLPEVSLADS
jgi:exopolyphosphatase/guanosine-5'-triphosphate,3'-diphosphate pyrophosphatase